MVRELLKFTKGYEKETILSPVFVSLEVILEVFIPFVMNLMINEGINKSDINACILYGVLMVVLSIFSLTFGIISGRYCAISSCGFATNLRRALYHKIQDYSFSNIDHFSTPSLITRITTDVNNVQNSFQMIIRVAVRAPFMIIFSLIMSMILNMKLAMIFVFAIPLLSIALYLVIHFANPYFKKLFKEYDSLNRTVQENISGIRTVKAFVNEEEEKKKFFSTNTSLYGYSKGAEKLLILNTPALQFVLYGSILLISYLSAKMVVADEMLVGLISTFLSYVMQILMNLMMFSTVLAMIVMSKASLDRILEVLHEKIDITNPENPAMMVPNGDIQFKDVTFCYQNGEAVLENINIDIKSGETVGIIGPTGSSKTSLVSLISRLYDVTSGELLVGGINVKNYDIEVLRNEVSVVLQKNVLFSGTIADNLRWGNEHATLEEIKHAAELACAAEFVERFPEKYDTHIDRGGVNVSGGQKQRLCIARALLKKPKILILDDSTSAVDTKTDSQIRYAFKTEIPNTTKIIIAQRISSVMEADKIIVLNDGKISDIGTHEELINRNELYRDIYNQQVKGA